MKKKIGRMIVLFIITAATVFLFASGAFAEETEGGYTYIVTGNSAVITKVAASVTGDVVIPATLGGYPVSELTPTAFSYSSGITGLTLPDSFSEIQSGNFTRLLNLTAITVSPQNEIFCSEDGVLFSKDKTELMIYPIAKEGAEYVIPDGVTDIHRKAFYGCEKLTRVDMPDGVTSIGYSAFYNCELLTQAEIPDSITVIGEDAFYNTGIYHDEGNWDNGILYYAGCIICTRRIETAKAITIRPGTVVVADSAFESCCTFTSVTFGDGDVNIGHRAFFGCRELTSVTFGDGDVKIGDMAFDCCDALENIRFGNGDVIIGCHVFSDCVALTSIVFGDGDVNIDAWTFDKCDALTSIVFGDGDVNIHAWTFDNCGALTDITVLSRDGLFQCNDRLPNITLHGYCGSAVKDFADKNNIPFVLLENSHVFAEWPAAQPTCTEPGHTDGVICAVCGEILVQPTELPAPGHVDADDDAFCDVCGEQVREKTFIEKIMDFFNKLIGFLRNLFI